MPIDARIALAGQNPNIAQTMGGGMTLGAQLAGQVQTQPYQNQLLEQRVAIQDEAMAGNERAKQLEAGSFVYEGLKSVSMLPDGQREAAFATFKNNLESLGYVDALGLNRATMDEILDSPEKMNAAIAAYEPFYNSAKGSGGYQKTATGLQFKDSQGNVFQANTVFDPQKGMFESVMTPVNPDGPQQPIGVISPMGGGGLTSDERVKEALDKETNAQQVAIRQGKAKEAYELIGKANDAIDNIDTAIKAIDSGANSGPVSNWFPSFRTSTIELQNAGARMGLDIIGAVTFGALSAEEMKLAMSTALPDLQPQELKRWLHDRRRAQLKLRGELMRAVQHFESNGSLDDYIKEMVSRGNYIKREDLPTVTSQEERDALNSGDYYLESDNNGRLHVVRKK